MKRRKQGYLIIIYLFLFIPARSQSSLKKDAAIKFKSSLQTGFLFGQSGSKPAVTISTVNGIQVNQWFAGIGIGIDYYGAKRSLPLFAAIQKDLSQKQNSFFLYGNAGYNIAWLKEEEKQKNVMNYKQMGGLYYETGIGYKLKISTYNYLGLSAGFSFKQIKEQYSYPCYMCGTDIGIPPQQIDNYKFHRLAIKLNWWFL